jgi:hypothetical protein
MLPLVWAITLKQRLIVDVGGTPGGRLMRIFTTSERKVK